MLKKLLKELGLGKIEVEIIEIPTDIVINPKSDDENEYITLGLLIGDKIIYENDNKIIIN